MRKVCTINEKVLDVFKQIVLHPHKVYIAEDYEVNGFFSFIYEKNLEPVGLFITSDFQELVDYKKPELFDVCYN
jgi:hypothetical protein